MNTRDNSPRKAKEAGLVKKRPTPAQALRSIRRKHLTNQPSGMMHARARHDQLANITTANTVHATLETYFVLPDAPRREDLRRGLMEAQRALATVGEIYPLVVRHADDLRNVLGEAWPVDLSRPTLILPTGARVVPIEGGGWQYLPA